MNILDQLNEIDKTTGDVDACLSLLKPYKKTHGKLYADYKKYWLLVYYCQQDFQSFDEFLRLPENVSLGLICKSIPKYLSLFSQSTLLNCLDYNDTELHPLIQYLWDLIPKEKILARLLNSENPQIFYNLSVKITTVPEIPGLTLDSYRLLLVLATPELLSSVISRYLALCQDNFLTSYIRSLCSSASLEKSFNLSNFRVIKQIMNDEGHTNISASYLLTVQNALIQYMAPPCISQHALIYELEEILDEIVVSDLQKLKEFVFGKMIAADIRGAIGESLLRRGIDCKQELELNKKKEKYLEKMPEDIGLELLNAANFEDAEDVIARWAKENMVKIFSS